MDNPYAPPQNLDQRRSPRLTPARWFGRVLAALLWSWVCGNVVMAAWLSLAAMTYGDIAHAFEGMTRRSWAPFVMSAAMSSILASYIGGFVGPIGIGATASRVRRPVLLSSVCGAAFAALIAAVAAVPAAWICAQFAPRSMLGMNVVIGLSLPVGALGGWLGARVVLDRPLSVGMIHE
jgi:ABC-type Na+ efflux pump permease subunit